MRLGDVYREMEKAAGPTPFPIPGVPRVPLPLPKVTPKLPPFQPPAVAVKPPVPRFEAPVPPVGRTLPGAAPVPVMPNPPTHPPTLGGGLRWYAHGLTGRTTADLAARPVRATLAATKNVLTTNPLDPFIRQVSPRAATWINRGTTGLAGVSAVAGVAAAPFAARTDATNTFRTALLNAGATPDKAHEAADNFHGQFFDTAWKLRPTWAGGEDSAIAKAHRDAATSVYGDWSRASVNNALTGGPPIAGVLGIPQEYQPAIGKGLDALRSATPLGALTTAGLYRYARPMDPSKVDATVSTLANRALPHVWVDAFNQPGASGVARNYADAIPDNLFGDNPEGRAHASWKLRNLLGDPLRPPLEAAATMSAGHPVVGSAPARDTRRELLDAAYFSPTDAAVQLTNEAIPLLRQQVRGEPIDRNRLLVSMLRPSISEGIARETGHLRAATGRDAARAAGQTAATATPLLDAVMAGRPVDPDRLRAALEADARRGIEHARGAAVLHALQRGLNPDRVLSSPPR